MKSLFVSAFARHLVFGLLVLVSLAASATEYYPLSAKMHFGDWEKYEQARPASYAIPCTYRSVSQWGDSITLSGKIFLPKSSPQGLILIPHYTIGARHEAPSECSPFEARLVQNGYVLVMPDYIGYGITIDSIHPYLDVNLTARNSVDMLLQAQSFLQWLLVPDNLYIVGFSQGAAAAMASLQLIEKEHPNIQVKKCFCGSGPYDVAATYDDAVERNRVGLPLLVPSLVLGTSAAYQLNLQPEYFFTPYLLNRYEKWIMSKKKGLVAQSLLMPSVRLSHYMTAEGMDKNHPETARLYEGFIRSSLVYISDNDTIFPDWQPQTPIYLFHSTNDDIVTFRCAEHMRSFLEASNAEVTYDFGKYGSHISSLLHFIKNVQKNLE